MSGIRPHAASGHPQAPAEQNTTGWSKGALTVSESFKSELVHLVNVDSRGKPFPWSERELQVTGNMPVQSLQTEMSIQIHCQPNVLSFNVQNMKIRQCSSTPRESHMEFQPK